MLLVVDEETGEEKRGEEREQKDDGEDAIIDAVVAGRVMPHGVDPGGRRDNAAVIPV